jgi:TolB-like protein/Tfp pilus assembly protein PilF
LRSISEGIEPEGIRARLWKAKLLRRKRAIFYACIACSLIVITVIALGLFTGGAAAIGAIAVLPFENLTGDLEQEFFVDAATDELIGQLAQIGAWRVISRRSVMQYKGANKPLPEIAQDLGVDAVVEGTVLHVGDSVRIRVQLIEALPEERNLWAQTYDRDLADVLVMYKEMARAIVDKTGVKLTPQEETILASTRQVNPEAYEAYTKGMFHFYKLTSQDLELAFQYFELALEKDPDYALAYVGIAHVWGGRQQQGLVSASEAGPKAQAARLKALELDDTLADVHYTFATQRTWGEWDWEGAEEAYERAIELNPNYPDPRAYYSQFLFMMNRPQEAMVQIERALELDPFSAVFRSLYAWDLMYAHRFDDAVEHLQETLRTSPTDQLTLSALKSAYHLKGMHEEALEIWRTWFTVLGDGESQDALTSGYEEGGYSGALNRMAEVLIARSRTTYVTPWQVATLYTRAGKNDEALEWLERAYEAHDSNMPYISIDPIFDGLRDDTRFQDLMRRMNFPDK